MTVHATPPHGEAMERFKAKVRRRDFEEDDSQLPADERWPVELQWVADWSRHDEDGRFISGCTSPHKTHAAALAEAIAEADEVRRRNALESTVRCPGCDCDPVGYAPHNGEGDCPPVTLDTATATCTTKHHTINPGKEVNE